jgi:hypothetical protein
VQGQGEQDARDAHDHRRHHRLRHLLDPASGASAIKACFCPGMEARST